MGYKVLLSMKQSLQSEFGGVILPSLLSVGVPGNSLVGATGPYLNRFVPTNDSLSQFDYETTAVDLCAVASQHCLTPKTNGLLVVQVIRQSSAPKHAGCGLVVISPGSGRIVDSDLTPTSRSTAHDNKARLADDRRDLKSLTGALREGVCLEVK